MNFIEIIGMQHRSNSDMLSINFKYAMQLNEIEEIKIAQRRVKRNAQAKVRREMKKIKTFMLDIKVKIIFDKYPEKVYIKDLLKGPYTEPVINIKKIIDGYNEHDGYKLVEVIGSNITYLNNCQNLLSCQHSCTTRKHP